MKKWNTIIFNCYALGVSISCLVPCTDFRGTQSFCFCFFFWYKVAGRSSLVLFLPLLLVYNIHNIVYHVTLKILYFIVTSNNIYIRVQQRTAKAMETEVRNFHRTHLYIQNRTSLRSFLFCFSFAAKKKNPFFRICEQKAEREADSR